MHEKRSREGSERGVTSDAEFCFMQDSDSSSSRDSVTDKATPRDESMDDSLLQQLHETLSPFNQEHVLQFWEELNSEERQSIVLFVGLVTIDRVFVQTWFRVAV